MPPSNPIAVIGLACWYPDARTPLQLWENILSRRRQFRLFPDGRLPLADYYDPDPKVPDKTYGRRGAFIDGFEFDWVAHRVPRATFQSTDIAHWLALEVALQAIDDAGFSKGTIPGDRTGVIVGNSLTGEQTRANTLRLRWPYVRRAFHAAAHSRGLALGQIEEIETALESYYKAAFPPTTEDSLAGGLSNTIAGRICNCLDLHGGGYTVDGACSSSLLAVATAANNLASGDLDLALAGGVDISLDPFEMVGFAKTGALTRKEMTVYDRGGSGFIPGEGCGFVVLKRLADAQRDNNSVYAVLHGWGIASDGGGTGITAPTPAGQAKALRKAYDLAPYDMDSLHFIEGHGTGTAVGDQVELKGIALAMGQGPAPQNRGCGVTSLKSIIGHAKAASGIGGFLKAVMAVNRRLLPPTASCRTPHALFDAEARQLYPLRQGEVLPVTETVRAGASAMGFGGINCHVTLASAGPPSPRLAPAINERALLVSNQETEVFVLAAGTEGDLIVQIEALIAQVDKISVAEMTDLAAKLSLQANESPRLRAALVAGEPMELAQGLAALAEVVRAECPTAGERYHDPARKIWLSCQAGPLRLGMLFPGQGSQKVNMARTLVERFAWAQELLAQADEALAEMAMEPLSGRVYQALDRQENQEQIGQLAHDLAQTEYAQPAICLTSILWLQFLRRLGIEPAVVGGHSLGELTAFHAAGVMSERELIRLAAVRGKAMAARGEAAGTMVSLRCSQAEAESLIDRVEGYLVLANINAPAQMVLSGEVAAVEQAIELAGADGLKSTRLNVSNAFHSRLASEAATVLAAYPPLARQVTELSRRLFSSASGKELTPGLGLDAHFSQQVLAQVDFVAMITAMSQECDLFLEVGPGRILSGLTSAILGAERAMPCLPVEAEPGQDQDLNVLLAELFVRGGQIRWQELYAERLVRPFIAPHQKIFIENQCEHPFAGEALHHLPAAGSTSGLDSVLGRLAQMSNEELALYLRNRGPFLAKVIQADLKYTFPLSSGSPTPDFPAHSGPVPVGSAKVSAPEAVTRTPAAILLQIVQAATGFPADSVSLDSRLLDDLNLDSIKAGDVLIEFASQCGVSGKLDPHQLTSASLQEVLAAVTPLLPNSSQSGQTQASVAETLFRQIEQISGFPRASLEPGMRLLDDLNLDSIKAGDLISQTAHELGVSSHLDTLGLTNATLAELISQFSSLGAGALPQSEAVATGRPDFLGVVLAQAAGITGFPKQGIDPDAEIETGLNLSEEMLRTLLMRAAAELEMEIHVDLPSLRNRSLRLIAHVLERIYESRGDGSAGSVVEEAESWVREFAMELVEEALGPQPAWWGKRQEDDWQAMNWLLLHEPESGELTSSLRERLQQHGAKVTAVTYAEASAQGLVQDASFSHIVAMLPQEAAGDGAEIDLPRIVERLGLVCHLPPASEAPRRRTTLAFLQFGGGSFGVDNKCAGIGHCCGRALAASLHLERADLRLRVLDFPLSLDSQVVVDKALAEINTPAAFSAVGYDFQQRRRFFSPRLLQPVSYLPRKLSWSGEDLILVSGGARGITAACALRVARLTGARMILVGRSPHPEVEPGSKASREIAAILQKYREMGRSVHYYSCDISDRASVQALLDTIRQEHGAITALIHGAGLNVPRLASQTTTAEALTEIGPKVLGMTHLLAGLSEAPPKLIVGLTSIIGLTGMAGNAWYGFSNEALDMVLRNFQARHPQVQSQAVAFSVWRDEGMGARLGSVAGLKQLGIDAIPTEEGVRRFAHLFVRDPGCHQVVVSARLGGLDTWSFQPVAMPAQARFLEKEEMVTPGVESVFSAHLSLAQDPYLQDHQFNGSYLLPTVFGLEAMAQAVAHVSGEHEFGRVRISDIKLTRPITVDPESGADIIVRAIAAESRGSDETRRVTASVSKGNTGRKGDYFSATFELGVHDEPPRQKVPDASRLLPLQPVDDLYRETLLFQGPLFQRIEQIAEIAGADSHAGHAEFTTRAVNTQVAATQAFVSAEHQKLYLGDPFYRDSLLQSTALLIPQDVSLPVAIGTLDIYQIHQPADEARLHGRVELESFHGKEIRSSVVAIDSTGLLRERLSGYDLRVLRHDPDYPTVSELLKPDDRDGARLRAILQGLGSRFNFAPPTLLLRYLPGIHTLPREERRQVSLPLLHETAQSALALIDGRSSEVEIGWLPAGRPVLVGHEEEIALSLSHDDRLVLCVAGPGAQGCDTAPITRRSREQWQGLLGRQGEVQDVLIEGGDDLDQAGTRVWAAMEAMHKAAGGRVERLEIAGREGEAVLFNDPSGGLVLTIPLTLTWGPARILALVIRPRERALGSQGDEGGGLRPGYEDLFKVEHMEVIEGGGPQGQTAFVQRFPVTFRASAQLSRTLYFSKYVDWIGEVREAAVWPVLGQLREQFSSGEWGQVTNATSLTVVGEAGTQDLLEVQVWASKLGGPADSTLELTFDFRKITPQGGKERLATLTQETSWVRILGQGLVRPEPFADYYGKFIRQLLPRQGSPKNPLPLPEALGGIRAAVSQQSAVYQAASGPAAKPMLHEELIATGLDHANLVGNIYFANYFTWQGRVRDRYLFSVAPEYLYGTGQQGELICLESRVDHLREAMPFDRVVVSMTLQFLSRGSAVFAFEYFRQEGDGTRVKLAFGEQRAAWVVRSGEGPPVLADFPVKFQQAFQKAIAESLLPRP